MLLAVSLLMPLSAMADMKPETRAAFDRYVQPVEAQFKISAAGPLLQSDGAKDGLTKEEVVRLVRGEVLMSKVGKDEDKNVTHGLIHHWRGTVFVPGAKLATVLSLVQDYDHHKDVYKPEVVDSKLISRDGDRFHAFLRFYKKKVIAVTLDTEHEATFVTVSPTRAYSYSHTTHVYEVEDAGSADEQHKPEGKGLGTMYALNSYWRYEERDGGVYIQCEAVSLSRDIPVALAWIIRPFVTDVPKESLANTLGATRKGLQKQMAKH